jgi:hypothetical protein
MNMHRISSTALNTGIFLLKWEVKQGDSISLLFSTLLLIILFRKFKTSQKIKLVTFVNDNSLITVTRLTIQLVNSYCDIYFTDKFSIIVLLQQFTSDLPIPTTLFLPTAWSHKHTLTERFIPSSVAILPPVYRATC